MPRVQVICFFYNEETLARLFVQHYAWADEILAVVSRSTDRTREVLEAAPNVRLIDFEFPAGMDDRIKTDKVNTLLAEPSPFDWKIVVDADEFIWPQSNVRAQDYLASVPERVTVLEARMRNVFRHHSEADLNLDRPPVSQRTHGDPDYRSPENIMYQKPIVIRAGQGICLDLGNHRQAGGTFDHAYWFEGTHWQNADPSFAVIRRVRDRRDRQSEANLRGGYGIQHHRVTEKQIIALCAARQNCPQIISSELKNMKPFPSITQLTSGETSQLPEHEDIRGWNSDDQIFDELVELLAPKTIIEVGSWKGRSAMHFARATERFATDIVCVDTWLGGVDHVLSSGSEDDRLLDSVGCPRLYHQFIRNFKNSPHAHRIYPIQNTSVNGARILSHHKVSGEIIYIDGSHEYADVHNDMCAFWPLVAPGGFMFGDDVGFPGVGPAVIRFTMEQHLKFSVVRNNFWVIKK